GARPRLRAGDSRSHLTGPAPERAHGAGGQGGMGRTSPGYRNPIRPRRTAFLPPSRLIPCLLRIAAAGHVWLVMLRGAWVRADVPGNPQPGPGDMHECGSLHVLMCREPHSYLRPGGERD